MRLTLLFPALAAGATLVPGSGLSTDVTRRAAAVVDEQRPARPQVEPGFAGVRAPDGLFYIRATAQGGTIDFAVDTGANMVILTPADARRLGVGDNAQAVQASTAAGATTMRRVRIDRLTIGGRVLRNVEAAIAGPNVNVSLLGQSALSRFDAVTFGRDTVRFD